MPSLRVVLGTNVLVSGLAFPGSIPGQIVAAWRQGAIDVVVLNTRKGSSHWEVHHQQVGELSPTEGFIGQVWRPGWAFSGTNLISKWQPAAGAYLLSLAILCRPPAGAMPYLSLMTATGSLTVVALQAARRRPLLALIALPPRLAFWVIFGGVGPVGLAYHFWEIGVKRGNIRLIVQLAYFIPVGSSLLISMFFRSSLSAGLWIGAALIAAGAWISSRADPHHADASGHQRARPGKP